MARLGERTVLELKGEPPRRFIHTAGWGGFVATSISAGKLTFLSQQLAVPRPTLALEHLPMLGRQLLEQMRGESPQLREHARADEGAFSDQRHAVGSLPGSMGEPSTAISAPTTDEHFRADAAHPRVRHTVQPKADSPLADLPADPSYALGAQCPEALETLELLDDLVFESIAGKPGALDQLKALWPTALAQVGPELINESREQYLQHALRVWQECVEGDQIHNPALAVATMDVICLLFNGA
jgi:hypothetical protein